MIINLGSMNIDYVYNVERFVQPGETVSSTSMEIHAGGKGLNQSIAASRAGAIVRHAGFIGIGNDFLEELLLQNKVDTTLIARCAIPNGHAIIQVDRHGQNCILLHAGTNALIDSAYLQSLVAGFAGDEIVLLQNETNGTAEMIELAKRKGCKIAFNPAPMTSKVLDYPLDFVDYLILNESEGEALAGETNHANILSALSSRYPACRIILTLGAEGVLYMRGEELYRVPAITPGKVLDTTAAGDTFIGYFLAAMDNGWSITNAIERAVKAAGICVTRRGSASSIPFLQEM